MFKIIILFNILLINSVLADYKLTNLVNNLDSPWSITQVNENIFLINEKGGNIKFFNKSKNSIKNIKHNLKILEHGQGGLMDIYFYKDKIYVSYTEEIGKKMESVTSVAVAKFNTKKLEFKNIFQSQPPIRSGYHFGSRIVIKNDFLYVSSGERGGGKIAQDGSKHPGSIIRIKTDGSIPKDNPKFKNKNNWLPEIYLIGIRNVQGMCLSPFDGKIFMTNHGAKGGDWFGKVNYGGNYGWDNLYWGGTKYSGLKGGPKWLPGYDKPIKYYVPSIAISACQIYNGDEFADWKGDALVVSLKDQSLRKIKFKNNNFLSENIIFKDQIGRLRDLKVINNGKIFILTDQGGLWELSKK
tara:strand:+ start:62 stop:1123 length:1062 start_codon:yes stop_codon:yes gene_type:complete